MGEPWWFAPGSIGSILPNPATRRWPQRQREAGSFYARIAAPMELLSQIRWLDILDILIVTFMAYRVWVWMRGTRALQILMGLLALGAVSLLAVRYQLSRPPGSSRTCGPFSCCSS